ncbi:organic cation transporter protein [Amyelois transitella]|uniref:organic cation transporter protein n=1 Tax=Amyelois transitella TaxID=680683 RepID=UPI002990000E|nr:organic cation transporter protein [Amyelois transitella]
MDNPKSSKRLGCNVDDITSKAIGDFGRWQLKVTVLMAMLKMPNAWYQLNIIFMAPPQDFWCEKPELFSQYSDEEWRKICTPLVEERPCFIFDPDMLSLNPRMSKALMPLVPCTKFVYNTTIFERTITSDWDLVCSKRIFIFIIQCTLMWGVLLGGIIFGVIADKYGRKIPLMAGIVIQSVASYVVSILPWFWAWLGVWFILALASGGIGIVSFVICMEAVGGKWRTSIPVLYQMPFGLGSTVMAILAYWLRDWRKLEFALATLSSLYIMYWFWVPESPRWLLATGQTKKALEVLKVAAKENNTEQNLNDTQDLLPKCEGIKEKGPGFIAFFKSKNMRLKTILLSLNWFFTGMAFYTFSQYLGLIADNIFFAVALSGVISLPGGILCVLIISKTGRKKTLWLFMVVTGACFIGIKLVPRYLFPNDWPRLLFAGIGFAGLGGMVPALYLYTGELFPTVGRNAGVGGVTIFARIAAMISPAVVGLDELVPDLPLIIVAITSIAQIFLIIPLPETKGYPLPDTLEQAEQFSNKKYKKQNQEVNEISE